MAGNGGGVGVLLQVDGQCALVSAPVHGVTIGPMDRVAAIQPDPGCGPGDKRPSGPLVCHATPDTLWAFHAKHGPRYDPGAGIPWPRSRRYQVVSGFPMAGSVARVAFIIEPVIATRLVRVPTDRLVRPVRGRKHGVDLGVGDRLALDPHLVALPSLGLGHHLGDQIPTQPHLPRLAPAGTSTTL